MKALRVALAQINPTVGDIEGNTAKVVSAIERAREAGADLVALPELALTGYPPEDLLLKPRFIDENLRALRLVREVTTGIVAVVGFVDRSDDIYNAAAVIADGRVADVYHKHYLPTYGVFDEHRYFGEGRRAPIYRRGEALFGVTICEDIWYPEGPARAQAMGGAEVIVNINASPYHIGKGRERERMLAARAQDSGVIIAYLNTVGGQDELVFDGGTLVIDERGEVMARARSFEEDFLVVDLDLAGVFRHRLHDPRRRQAARPACEDCTPIDLGEGLVTTRPPLPAGIAASSPDIEEEAYRALVLGLRDYVGKNGFRGVLVGLSGGADSAFVAVLAADALGGESVHCIFMPSRYSSDESAEDAAHLARNLGVSYSVVPIDATFGSYLDMLSGPFAGLPADTTEENLQARIRGNVLMAHSNKLGYLVLTTGNKSEMSVGYATLYGDMAGGFAVVKDVPKTLLYRLCAWRNRQAGRDLIPARILTKEPTAELRPGQKDTDSLPPYEVLDPILRAYIEEERSLDEIVFAGIADLPTARRVIAMVDRNEYKRRQSPPGIKITPRAFGRDRRMPITNLFRSDSL
jgi:NAD+ synthase (glutamine-hydrolysing)